MSKKPDTWMPFYVGDYLSATGRLTTEQHGAYLLILLDYWKNGPPPNDDAVLAALARVTLSAWRKMRPTLIGFFEIRDGLLIQKRVEAERAHAGEVTEERRKAGKAGAETRWQKHRQNGGKPIANAMANAKQNDAPSQPPSNKPHTSSLTTSRPSEPLPEGVDWTADLALNYVCQAAGWWPATDNQRADAIGTINGWLRLGCSMKLILAGIGLALKRKPGQTKRLTRFSSTIEGMRRDELGGELPVTEDQVGAVLERTAAGMRVG